MNFEVIIGIEIHLELLTKTKMFSPAPNTFGKTPNSNVSIIDMAYPGTLPLLNKQAVILAIRGCKALNLHLDRYISFDRKNYFYPDLTKGYQITQDKRPIGSKGYIEIEVEGVQKRIGITRMHLEEDTAKQLHFADYTLLDYNRCGVPLVEIVSEPDIRSPQEAGKYIEKLRQLMLFSRISDAKMEEGSMRCDVNISLRPYGTTKFGTKVEIKNLNSISNVVKAAEYEIKRQERILLSGGEVEQETRRYDETLRQTVLMRKKSNAVDYKYFAEANIVPFTLSEEFVEKALEGLKDMPDIRYKKYIEQGLNDYSAKQLLLDVDVADYFEAVNSPHSVEVANLILGDVFSYLNKRNMSIKDYQVTPSDIAELINLLKTGKISSKQLKTVFEEMNNTLKSPNRIIKELGLEQVSDDSLILSLIKEVLDANPDNIKLYKSGKDNLLSFFVGQVMKKSLGKANPAMTSKLLKDELEKR